VNVAGNAMGPRLISHQLSGFSVAVYFSVPLAVIERMG
jgi:hypothetical protein